MYEENDRKNQRRDNFRKKHLKNRDDNLAEHRDNFKLKKALKSKIDQIREQELWEDWEDEIS